MQKRKHKLLLILIPVIMLGLLLFPFIRSLAGTFSPDRKPHRMVDPDRPMVALTFDDGPHPDWTPVILDCLEKHGAAATFFEVGSNMDLYPALCARAEELGCEVGSHTYSHIDLTASDAETIEQDLRLCDRSFRLALGHAPTLMRPPGGAVNGQAKRLTDLPLIGWSLDTKDWQTRDTAATVAAVQEAGNLDGQVILMHSLYQSSARAAEILIPWLLDQGYQLVTVSELMQVRYETLPQPHIYNTVDFFLYGADPAA